ncbi:MAG: WD repeat domain phosphoinositide-interacting protein 3 [Peltula sp. TS41687]|nr:MAG: WD repeat domain phosphoinositide-interacting protein 3 [Peltula sp. TS41687]
MGLVGGGKQPKFAPHKVIIWDDSSQKIAMTLEFRSPVHGVRLSRNRIVVVLQNSVHIYNFASPPERISGFETADNPLGLCCLSARYLAFPGRTPGQVQLVEWARGNVVSIIPAHSSPLRALELSPDGELLVTASETGTLIRVFSTTNCARLEELRRGVDPAVIYALAISPSSKLLAVTSDKSTLHIFDLPQLGTTESSTNNDRHHRSGSNSSSRSPSTAANAAASGGGEDSGRQQQQQKWGILGRIPLMPRVFSDTYSFASAPFETGTEPTTTGPIRPGSSQASSAMQSGGVSRGRPPKGVIGWLSDRSLVVVGAGSDGKWERFVIGETQTGERYCVRDGWRRYLGAG